MKQRMTALLGGDGLKARALRGSMLTLTGFGGQQVLRLAGNLVLTRILFPEAFGLMALVQIFLVGLAMFSDIGINTSIMQNKRGDDPDFLNTAWTVQVLRGVILWLGACALAVPAARFYEAPELAALLPVAGLTAIVTGFQSTRIATANRNILLGRLTLLELGTQAFGVAIMVILAWWLQSVWALVLGGLVAAIAKSALSHLTLPGIRNRFTWDRTAFSDIFHFGKYLFLSTLAGFLVANADRAILGKYVSLTDLAIYNIAFFLASVPLLLSQQLVNKIMMPLYRERPPAESPENRQRIARARFMVTGSLLGISCILALGGDVLIRFLYDTRYHGAGPVMVLLSLAIIPAVITNSYGSLLLAQGASRSFSVLMITTAVLRTLVIWACVHAYGFPGAIAGLALSSFLAYPIVIGIIRTSGGWDHRHDLAFGGLMIGIATLAIWVNYPAITGFLTAP